MLALQVSCEPWNNYCQLTLMRGRQIQAQSYLVRRSFPLTTVVIRLEPGKSRSFKLNWNCRLKIPRGVVPEGHWLYADMKYMTPSMAADLNNLLDGAPWPLEWPLDRESLRLKSQRNSRVFQS